MRESLTILAGALILLLSVLLVGPYLVDWNSQRDWLAARLSAAIGAQVKITGPVEVRLLPTPIFRAGAVAIEGAGPKDPRVQADHLDAELSINGLLRGAVEFVDARIAAPRLDLTLREDGSIVGADLDVKDPQRIQFTRAIVSDGAVVIHDESGAERFALGGIAAQGEAETLFGPWKLNGTAEGRSGKLSFRLNTGAYAARKLRLRLVVDQPAPLAHADIDGQVAVAPPGQPGRQPLSFAGTVNLAGSLRLADGAAPVPWRVVATGVTADAQAMSAAGVELRAGFDGRALVANGTASVALGSKPSASVALAARQLDLDRLAVAPEIAPDTPRPTVQQWVALARAWIDDAEPPSLPLTLSAAVDAVTVGDLTFTDARASLGTDGSAPARATMSIAGPNGSRVALDGNVERGAAAAFKGRIAFATRDLPTAAGWLDPFWPGAAFWVDANLPVQEVAAEGVAEVTRVGASGRDIVLTADGSTLRGTMSVTAGVGTERPRYFADLTADALDVDRLPSFRAMSKAAQPLDLSVALAANRVTIGSPESPGALKAGRMTLRLAKTGDQVRLEQFALDSPDIALTATASIDDAGRLQTTGQAHASDPRPLAALLRGVLPGALSDGLASHADALSPLDLAFSVEGGFDGDAGFMPSRLSGQGTAGDVRVAMSVSPEPGGAGGSATLQSSISLDVADAAAAFRRWGLFATARPLGGARLDATARGRVASGFDTHATLSLANGTLTFNGRAGQDGGRGQASAVGSDLATLLAAAAFEPSGGPWPWSLAGDVSWGDGRLALDKLAGRLSGNAVTGALAYRYGALAADAAPTPASLLTGSLAFDRGAWADLASLALGPAPRDAGPAWSKTPFADPPVWPRTEMAVRFGTLALISPLVARDAVLNLRLMPGIATISDLSAHLLDGTVGGTVTIRRDGAGANLSGRVQADGLTLALPSLSGRLSGAMTVASTGATADQLVGNLAGDGSLSLTGARMPRFDPAALMKTATLFDVEGAAVDDAAIRDALGKALDRAPLALGDLGGQASLAAGTLRVVGAPTRTDSFKAATDATFTLRDIGLTLRTALTTTDRPKDWKGDPPQVTVTWSGAPAAPARDIDAAAFANGIAARAIARDQERIELMQADLRERAFFARRLKAIEAEQQAARDAAQIQKMVPTPPPRPGSVSVPKPPDAPAPPVRPAAPPSPAGPPGSDAITDLIKKQLGFGGDAAGAPPSLPLDLQPKHSPAVR